MTRRKKIEAPLTTSELREKVKNGALVMPSAAQDLPLDDFKGDKDNPQFSSVELGGVFSNSDVVGVDGKGREHKFPGGMGFVFNWVAPGIGFGEFHVKRLSDGTTEIDSEEMGKEFFKKALCALIDSAKDTSSRVN